MGSPPPRSAQPACSLAVPSLHSWRNGLPGRHADHSHQPRTGQMAGEGRAGLLRPAVCPPDTCPAEPSRKQGGAGQAPATSGTARVLPVFPPCRLLAFLCVSLNQFCFRLLCNVLLSATASTLRPPQGPQPEAPCVPATAALTRALFRAHRPNAWPRRRRPEPHPCL